MRYVIYNKQTYLSNQKNHSLSTFIKSNIAQEVHCLLNQQSEYSSLSSYDILVGGNTNKGKIIKRVLIAFALRTRSVILWTHLGSNQGPPDYESGALTN
jgi:hypothetical protein